MLIQSDCGQYSQYLGQEFPFVVYNCYSGFRANAVMALCGTIQAGGLLVLLCPPLVSWPGYADPQWQNRLSFGYLDNFSHSFFIQHLINCFANDQQLARLTPHEFSGPLALVDTAQMPVGLLSPNRAINPEQQLAIEGIIKVACGHRNRPLVLSADRGRGKSSALGLAAARLISEHGKHILVTAPSPETVKQVFFHASQALELDLNHKHRLVTNHGSLVFCAPDALLHYPDKVDIVLIDEAAALPTHLLTSLIDRYSRLVFSTTLHGYEGSGRGFELRVKKYLHQHKPQWHGVHLQQPVRWYQGDPLEQFWFNTLLMQQPSSAIQIDTAGPFEFTLVSKQQLVDDIATSAAIFQLLVDAHYQTSPDDLIRLFDSPEQHCYVLRQGRTLVGVALIIAEGGELLRPLQDEIAAGARRVKGHLMPQNLSFHYAQPEFCTTQQWRVTRLAIAPQFQRSGLGKALLKFVCEHARRQHIALVSSSFGLTRELLHFWQQAGFQLVNLAHKPEISSAEHSAQFVLPLDTAIMSMTEGVSQQCQAEIVYQSDKAFQQLDPLLLYEILSSLPAPPRPSRPGIKLQQFIQGTRPLAACQRELHEFCLSSLKAMRACTGQQIAVLIAVLIQHRPLNEVAKQFALSGKASIVLLLRNSLATMLRE